MYKRLTPTGKLKAYELFLKNWVSTENIFVKSSGLTVVQALYSSVEDAEADPNRWQYCNYADGWVLGALPPVRVIALLPPIGIRLRCKYDESQFVLMPLFLVYV